MEAAIDGEDGKHLNEENTMAAEVTSVKSVDADIILLPFRGVNC